MLLVRGLQQAHLLAISGTVTESASAFSHSDAKADDLILQLLEHGLGASGHRRRARAVAALRAGDAVG